MTNKNTTLSESQIKESITKLQQRKENRKHVKLWRHPLKTIKYFGIVLKDMVLSCLGYFRDRPLTLFLWTLLLSSATLAIYAPGRHQEYIGQYTDKLAICLWWVGLGVLSSVGLGTGLHTFVLYLGPHIAKVTWTATEWQTLDFEQYGPNAFINPNAPVAGGITFWQILQAIQIAALCWGAGTAIALIGNMGFFGILAFASIPNPLFDLAGITCGHYLVPFWKFFGATLIGKAVIKAHIQACFVVLAFNTETLTAVVNMIETYIPLSKGKILPILEKERQRMNSESGVATNQPKSLLGVAWDCILALMIFYFLVSIIDSSVQEYLIEKDKKKIEKLEALLSGKNSNKNKVESKKDK
ncbi:hypothetical protein SAMD00019534_060400 [Acytostelium subglobosum LB1]|uniref:hypothetical protein n=1 Tax=Acytostelium subglobosum LB1 TaxID=1410327 RepID=UPI000644BBEE|nr:hypothetical protein SAMD00019534_060400 [Acytostelium subglobosum LB1]GAM22865.1 hypothetical protein SAMD00019534_060400 [Acytostelium subglobosum LB1]|eukprot:XP_012754092.1 hypothetical protein SAMD00019534_060400 [Acytostelium subglobosum LB1]